MSWYKNQIPKSIPIAKATFVSSMTPKVGTAVLHDGNQTPKPTAIHHG